MLAQYYIPELRKKNNVEYKQIFAASDCTILMSWLLNQKLLIHLKQYQAVVVHAGIYPLWSLKRAVKEAKKVEACLIKNPVKFFKKMYGAKPNHWDKTLKGMDRSRFTVNSLTRMRFLYKNGGLNFKAKDTLSNHPKLIPWFQYKLRKKLNHK